MKTSNNNQPPKPDYSFIVDQANPVKTNNKKMVIIILMIVLLSVATVAYLFQSSTNNVQKQNLTKPSQQKKYSISNH